MDLYVYYRADAERAEAVQAAVAQLQQRLRAQLGAGAIDAAATDVAAAPGAGRDAGLQSGLQVGLEDCLEGGVKHGFKCGLKRRPRAIHDDPVGAAAHADPAREIRDTWMEIYLAAPDRFPALLAAAVADSALPPLIDGDRHVELFLEALPCA